MQYLQHLLQLHYSSIVHLHCEDRLAPVVSYHPLSRVGVGSPRGGVRVPSSTILYRPGE